VRAAFVRLASTAHATHHPLRFCHVLLHGTIIAAQRCFGDKSLFTLY
jgi:hypothetical protein